MQNSRYFDIDFNELKFLTKPCEMKLAPSHNLEFRIESIFIYSYYIRILYNIIIYIVSL